MLKSSYNSNNKGNKNTSFKTGISVKSLNISEYITNIDGHFLFVIKYKSFPHTEERLYVISSVVWPFVKDLVKYQRSSRYRKTRICVKNKIKGWTLTTKQSTWTDVDHWVFWKFPAEAPSVEENRYGCGCGRGWELFRRCCDEISARVRGGIGGNVHLTSSLSSIFTNLS